MTRGNQREIDRARAQKRAEKKGGEKQGDFQKRMFTDAEIMREKQKKAEEKKQKEEEESIAQQKAAKGDMSYLKQFEELEVNDEEEEKKEPPVEMMKPLPKKGGK